MPNSLVAKIKKLAYQNIISDKDRDRIIKALEQEPCEDCISRQAVLDLPRIKTHNEWGNVTKESVDVEEVRQLPSVTPKEPKTDWIPVSERLPNNDEDVLVCYSQGGMEVVYYHIDSTFYPTEYADLNETGWFNEDGDALYFEPIAWMPLPKPYKESEE